MKNRTNHPAIVNVLRQLRSCLPSGAALPAVEWGRRLHFLITLTWVHAAAIALSGFTRGSALHHVSEALIVAAFAAFATWGTPSRTAQAAAVTLGLLSSSAILVHLSGGYIELHFHFFVMLVLLALLGDWTTHVVAVGFVAAHHGLIGVRWPAEIYGHEAAINAPWAFAGLHALFVLWACLGSVIAWKFKDQLRHVLLHATASR